MMARILLHENSLFDFILQLSKNEMLLYYSPESELFSMIDNPSTKKYEVGFALIPEQHKAAYGIVDYLILNQSKPALEAVTQNFLESLKNYTQNPKSLPQFVEAFKILLLHGAKKDFQTNM